MRAKSFEIGFVRARIAARGTPSRRSMDREEAASKKLAPPPTKQGWLHKKGGTALSAERRRWFVLQGAGAEATLRYSKEVHGGHRGTIRCEDIRGVVQDENALDIYTPDRTYHVRASSEQSAGQWATVIRCAAAGAEEVESSSDDEEETTGIPWMIDGAIAASRRVVVSSLHCHESSPGMMDVGGFFFDFDRDAPRRRLGRRARAGAAADRGGAR